MSLILANRKPKTLVTIGALAVCMTACNTEIECDDGYELDDGACHLEDEENGYTPTLVPDDTGHHVTTHTDCDRDILEVFPVDGATDVYYRTSIEFALEIVDGSETITVMQGDTEIPGSMGYDELWVSFVPDNPLTPNRAYEVILNWCDDTHTSTAWTTSEIGAPVDPSALIGQVFAMEIGQGRFVRPPGIGPLLQQQADEPILLGVTSQVGNDLHIIAAPGTFSDEQDLCRPSVAFPQPAPFGQNPYFETGEGSQLELMLEGISLPIANPQFTGAFSVDGAEIAGVTLTGLMDTRPMAGLVGATGDDDAMCDLVLTFGVSCEPCPDGQPYCLDTLIDTMTADLASGVYLQPVTPQQAAQNCP